MQNMPTKKKIFFLKAKPPKRKIQNSNHMLKAVHLVLHPHEIAPTFLKLDSLLPWVGFFTFLSTEGTNQIKKEKL